MKIRLQTIRRAKKRVMWNTSTLKKTEIGNAYRMRLDRKLQEEKIDGQMEIGEIWNKMKECIETVAEEICGKEQMPKRQNWMNLKILRKMEERRNCKNRKEEEQYRKLKHEIQRMCREAKDKYFEDKCKEIEILDKVHSQLLYQKIKELRPKGKIECSKLLKVNRGRDCMKEKR
jgi:hypothetical protein